MHSLSTPMRVLYDNGVSPELPVALSACFATPEDRPCLLAAVASTASPLRFVHAVDTLLTHPSVYPCFLVGKGETLAGVTPVTLVPHLALGSLVAWLLVGVMVLPGDPVTRDVALMAVNEYARAHGIPHVLLPPAALLAEDAVTSGFVPNVSGCWRRSACPSSKVLG